MRRIAALLLVLGLGSALHAQETDAAKAQHVILGQNAAGQAYVRDVRVNDHPDAQWFPEAGLGLFIHYGLAAEHGGIDLSWGMYANKSWEDGSLMPTKYWGLADKWNPDNFKPMEWIDLVAKAGFKYIVFTTKHHDGYTLWPSNYGDIGIKQKLGGKDLVRDLVDACRAKGLKVGLYYSPPDWHFDRAYINWDYSGKTVLDVNYKQLSALPKADAAHVAKKRELVRGQLTELLTNYGQIDLLWFDGGAGEMTNDEVRSLQPGIVINRRNGEIGDYADSEGVLPTQRFETWFETCDPAWPARWWTYSTSDRMMGGDKAIENLVVLRAWNGNYLANVGPKGDGSMPEEAMAAWQQMADWMEHSEESVYETTAGGFPETANQPITWKGDRMAYIHLYPNFHQETDVQVNSRPKKVTLLRTKKTIPFAFVEGRLKIQVDPQDRTRMVDVLKVEW